MPASGQRTGLASTCSSVTEAGSISVAQIADLIDVADDLDTVGHFEQFLGDRRSRDAHCGFAGRGASAAAIVAEAELGVEGEVGVARPVLVLDVAVVLAALVLVADEDGDGRAGGLTFEDAGEDLGGIIFLPRADNARLPGLSALQVRNEVIDG